MKLLATTHRPLTMVLSLIIVAATATTGLKCLTLSNISVCLTPPLKIMKHLTGRVVVGLDFGTKSKLCDT